MDYFTSENDPLGGYTLESIRTTVKRRDGISDAEVTELFVELRAEVEEGEDPEEALANVFGLEPDYVFDSEFIHAITGVY